VLSAGAGERGEMSDLDPSNVERLLSQVGNPASRNDIASQLSKVAAKAEGAYSLCSTILLRPPPTVQSSPTFARRPTRHLTIPLRHARMARAAQS
jgi:hypothetical protein